MRILIFGLVGIVVMGLLFIIIQPSKLPPIENTATSTTVTPVADKVHTFEIVIEDGKSVSGSTTLTVNQGDGVIINVTADEEDELHLHGYDIKLALTQGVPGQIQIKADKSGRFPMELHNSGTEIGALEVSPK